MSVPPSGSAPPAALPALQAALADQGDVEVSIDEELGVVDVRPAFDL